MTEPVQKPRHPWLRFSLRILLLLVVVIAVPLAWKMNRVRNQRRVVAELKVIPGTTVGYDYQKRSSYGSPVSPSGPKWLRQILGDDFFAEVTHVTLSNPELTDDLLARVTTLPGLKRLEIYSDDITDSGLACVANATNLETFILTSESVTDAGIAHLLGLTRLKECSFEGKKITDLGLEHISHLKQLEHLNLEAAQVTDSGLQEIAKLPHLHILSLQSTKITDAGLQHLTSMTQLQLLMLSRRGSKVTKDGVERFRATTECRIDWR